MTAPTRSPTTVLLPTNRRLLTNVRLPRPAAVCCSAANLQCHCVDEMFLQCHLPEVTAISPCLKWLLSEVPNTSTPGPKPVAFTRTRVFVDIFGAIDFTPLQDAFTPFLGARNFHEEQERCFPCVLSDFRLWFGCFHRGSLSLGQPHCYHNYDPV